MSNQDRDKIQSLILIASDAVCLIASYFIAGYLWYVVYKGSEIKRVFQELSVWIGTVLLAYVLLLLFFDMHQRFFERGALEELKYTIAENLLLAAIISTIEYAQHSDVNLSRGVAYSTVMINIVLMYQLHYFLKQYMLIVFRNKKAASQVLLLTTADRVDAILEEMKSGKEWMKRITGIVLVDDDKVGEKIDHIPVVTSYHNIIAYATEQIVDEVFIDIPYESGDSLRELILAFENMGVKVQLNLEILKQFQDFYISFDTCGQIPVITFSNREYDYKQLIIKRAMDIVGSIVGIFLTLIITIFLAPALLLESPGPLIFKQKRVGKNGRFFYMYKFRSMYVDAEERKQELLEQNEMDGLMFKMENDPRITRVGRFIRKTSIDEFPQFFNVLKGDMSLVGTRPPTVDEFVQYKSYHKRRLSAKPGITGLWQVSGRNDIDKFEDVVKLDLEYIDNWSIYLDVKILIKTVGAIFTHSGK
jgi:exopolysaccharide biosynthesis polyprenyl glycosylphosphotransferase